MSTSEEQPADGAGSRSPERSDIAPPRTCLVCKHPNPRDSNYCANCAEPLEFVGFIQAAVSREVAKRFSDKSAVAIEVSESIRHRLERRAGWIVAVFTTALAVLAFLGYSEYSDFKEASDQARAAVRQETEKALTDITAAEEDFRTAKSAVAKDLSGFREDVHAARDSIGNDRESVQRFASEASRAYAEINKLGSELDQQRRKLETTDAIVTALYERAIVEEFSPEGKSRFFRSESPRAVVLVLSETPIIQTVEISYDIYYQPKSAYLFNRNLVLVPWRESVSRLDKKFIVSYVPDPLASDPPWKSVTIKGDAIEVDGQPVFTLQFRNPVKRP